MTSSRAEELAAQFEAKNAEFVAFVETLTGEQWRTLVPNEQRTVAALAHHLAWGYRVEIEPFHQMAQGLPAKAWSEEELNAVNARLGEEYAVCDRQETLDLLAATAAETAAIVRSLTDEQLARSGKYLDWLAERSVDAWVDRILPGHIETHWRSIRDALSS
jgi:hypothetical protein